MGVFIQLGIVPEQIPASAWQDTYEQSLKFLQAYPLQLMGVGEQHVGSQTRRVYARQLEHQHDDPNGRHWHVVGDFDNMERAESFLLYANIEHYRDRWRPSDRQPPKDIVQDLVAQQTYPNNVFSSKSQGHPYHIAMLAVGMLVESRFPSAALVSGDIDTAQARIAQAQLRDLLGEDIPLPISVDADRLWARLTHFCDDHERLQLFDRLFRGDGEALFRIAEPGAVSDWFREQLRGYRSPSQLGVIALLIRWLNAERDLKTLYQLACIDESGPHFDPSKFTQALASTWVTVPPATRAAMDPFRKPDGATDTVATLLGSALLDMSGAKGRDIRRYIPQQEVAAVVAELFPNDRGRLEAILDQQTRKAEQLLTDSREPIQALDRRSEEEVDSGDGRSFLFFTSVDDLSGIQVDMFRLQAYQTATLRRLAAEKIPEAATWDKAELKTQLIGECRHTGLRLTEDAWAWIDAEEDQELLMQLYHYAVVQNQEQTFWNLRLAMFENRKLAQAVLAASRDEALLADVQAKLDAISGE